MQNSALKIIGEQHGDRSLNSQALITTTYVNHKNEYYCDKQMWPVPVEDDVLHILHTKEANGLDEKHEYRIV